MKIYIVTLAPEPCRFEQEHTLQETMGNQFTKAFTELVKAETYRDSLYEMYAEDMENPDDRIVVTEVDLIN